jgi:hypothetical protein
MSTKPIAVPILCAALAWTAVCRAQTPFPMSPNPVVGASPSFGTLNGRAQAADLNGDGRHDVVAAAPGNNLSIMFTAPGGGYLAPVIAVTAPPQNTITAPQAVADLTNDGIADVLASFTSPFPPFSPPATTQLFPGLGNGTLGLAIPVPVGAFNPLSHTCFVAPNIPGVTVPGGPPALVVHAVQNLTGQPGTIAVLAFAGGAYSLASSMIAPSIPALSTAGLYALRMSGDCDGDGLLDLAGTGGPLGLPTHLVLFRGMPGSPHFAAPSAIPAPVPVQNGTNFLFADATQDGLADVVAVKSGGPGTEIVVFPGHPTTPFTTSIVSNIGVQISQIWTEDVDDDGLVDLFVVTAPQTPSVYGVAISRGLGGGTFGPVMALPSSAATSSNVYAFADENGDGRRDAVACAATGSNTFVLHDQARMGPGVPGFAGLVPYSVAGVATPGNPAYFVGVTGAAASSTAIVGVSLAVLPAPDAVGNLLDLSPAALILPTATGPYFQTGANGAVIWQLGLPPPPALAGLTVYLEWAVVDPVSGIGFSITPARKIVFW